VVDTRRHGFGRRERPQEIVDPAVAVASHEADVVRRDALWEAVLALPRRQRAVIVLRYYEDLTEAAIAEALGCSRGTVKSQASAALSALRRRHGDVDAPEEDA
jgi:RNA polymerase sigma factor (sigma-70 family)